MKNVQKTRNKEKIFTFSWICAMIFKKKAGDLLSCHRRVTCSTNKIYYAFPVYSNFRIFIGFPLYHPPLQSKSLFRKSQIHIFAFTPWESLSQRNQQKAASFSLRKGNSLFLYMNQIFKPIAYSHLHRNVAHSVSRHSQAPPPAIPICFAWHMQSSLKVHSSALQDTLVSLVG